MYCAYGSFQLRKSKFNCTSDIKASLSTLPVHRNRETYQYLQLIVIYDTIIVSVGPASGHLTQRIPTIFILFFFLLLLLSLFLSYFISFSLCLFASVFLFCFLSFFVSLSLCIHKPILRFNFTIVTRAEDHEN
jgi:hypothetical protein